MVELITTLSCRHNEKTWQKKTLKASYYDRARTLFKTLKGGGGLEDLLDHSCLSHIIRPLSIICRSNYVINISCISVVILNLNEYTYIFILQISINLKHCRKNMLRAFKKVLVEILSMMLD